MNGFIWSLVILYWLALYVGNVWLCFTIASQKNRNDVGWGWLAVFLGIPATLTVVVLKPLQTTLAERTERQELQQEIKEWKTSHIGLVPAKLHARISVKKHS